MSDTADFSFAQLPQIIAQAYSNYAAWLWQQISHPFSAHNYFSMLMLLSLLVYACELTVPWRRQQAKLRRDFWLDAFYMLFNFFLFGLLIYAALAQVSVDLLNQGLALVPQHFILADYLQQHLSTVQHLLLLFIIRDFIQWWIHRALHYFPLLWRFHQVHHSVREMGFAAHFRFHWMEIIIYNSLQFIPLYLLGFSLVDFFTVSMISTAIGHLNHANLQLALGPLRYVLNNPQMHIWHHSKTALKQHPHGVNFGLSLSCWDYLFGSAHIPHNGRDIELGFTNVETYPQSFIGQSLEPFRSNQPYADSNNSEP